jgi:lipopolysaccharide export system permease protein
MSIFVAPWANAQIEAGRKRFAARDDVSRVAPGRFIESGGADRVFFIESVDIVGGEIRNIFVSTRSQGREGVVVAARGHIEDSANGDRFVVLEKGRRYEGSPGMREYRTMEFDRYAFRLESRPDAPLAERTVKTRSMLELIADPTPYALGELMWRVGIPVVALLVTLLAIPLAYTNPRVGRSFNLIFAVLAFAIYLNALNTVQAWVQQGRMSFAFGVWVVHGIVAAIVVALFIRRVYMQRWFPRWLSPSHWRARATGS